MEQFGLLRIEYPSFENSSFKEAILELQKTKYDISAKNNTAPQVTHCISAVRYAIRQATGWEMPLVYIGDMCRTLLYKQSFPSHIIPISEGEIGDLIFFHGKSSYHKSYMIKHVGILTDSESFFHSSYSKGGSIENIEPRISKGSIATCKILSNHTDPRILYFR